MTWGNITAATEPAKLKGGTADFVNINLVDTSKVVP